MFGAIYRGRRVLVTGHTGFKGSWLSLWLQALGAQVHGLSLPSVTQPSHWGLLDLSMADERGDIRDTRVVADAVRQAQPEVVFHLAAQSLVRPSYADPLGTWATNVMGTAHLLQACREVPSVRAVVVVTSDKCYENREANIAYREGDALGGHDPYSASKAASELVAASFRLSFFHDSDSALVATARAGNVIGGGDWSQDRLIPDLARALARGEPLLIRSPLAVRPWQHVLESLSGYLLLGQRLLQGDAKAATAWNFGPPPGDARTVQDVLQVLQGHWPEAAWREAGGTHPHEAQLLQLDSAKARTELDWQPVWPLDTALTATAAWYRAYLRDQRVISRAQLDAYVEDAATAGLTWAKP